VTQAGPQLQVDFRARGGVATKLTVDRLINCTGPNQDYSEPTNPLLAALLGSGIIRPHPSGLGIDVDPSGAVIGASGETRRRVYAVGPPCEGALLEITVIREIRSQASDIALGMIREIYGSTEAAELCTVAPS
jgi:uncharacterized NAD(P)/FAD-binding protein YdhS